MDGAALTVLSKVDYRSGEIIDTPRDGRVLWDLSHAAGAIELDLSTEELAVGCTYKYLNGGPGAPAFLYVRKDLQHDLSSPIQGWFGQRDQFAMGPRYEPAAGVERFLAGTPPILNLVAVQAGVELTAEAGMPAIAAKTQALTDLFIELHGAWLADLGFELATPRNRGGHVSLAHPQGWQVCRALIERANVVPDFREPDIVRFGFPALYTRFEDVYETAKRTKDLVALGAHKEMDPQRTRVT
jgi:kynureninase